MYAFFTDVTVEPLTDGSGFALYSDYTGNTAFLNSPDSQLSSPEAIVRNRQFSVNELAQSLGVTEDVAKQSVNWLVNNKFIQAV